MNPGKPGRGDSAGDEAPRELARGVFRLARRLRIIHNDAKGGLSTLSLLASIHRIGPAPAARLAQEEGLQPQSLTRLVADLEARGLIARREDETDRRRILIETTREGRRALAADMARLWDWLGEAMTEALDEEERALLARSGRLMERLAAL